MSYGHKGKQGSELEDGAQRLPENSQPTPEELRHFIARLESEITELKSMHQEMQGEKGSGGGYQDSISQKLEMTEVKQQFDSFRHTQWKYAFEHLSSFNKRTEEKYNILNTILMDAYNVIERIVNGIYRQLETCKSSAPALSPDKGDMSVNIPEEISKFLRTGVREEWNSQRAQELVKKEIQKRTRENWFKDKSMTAYLDACCKVAWMLTLQRPQMYLFMGPQNGVYNTKYHEVEHPVTAGRDYRIRGTAMPGVVQDSVIVIKAVVLLQT